MKRLTASVLMSFLLSIFCGYTLKAQTVCDPSFAPANLQYTYTPGFGLFLSWDAIPGSVGVQIKVEIGSSAPVSKIIVGPEPDQYFVPDFLLAEELYTWRVQAACSSSPPFNLTPISNADTIDLRPVSNCPATVGDLDGNTYPVVEIGGQCWIKENLKSVRYNNGDSIPTGLTGSAWGATTEGAYSVFSNNEINRGIYGLMYNFNAIVDPRGLCPIDWHIPSDAEWTTLTDFLGGAATASGPMKTVGTLGAGTGLWRSPNSGATNASGFSALPGGERKPDGSYVFLSYYARFWSNTSSTASSAFGRRLYNDRVSVQRDAFAKSNGFYVRCLKD